MRKIAKPTVWLALCLAILFLLAACGKASPSDSSSLTGDTSIDDSGTSSEDFWADPDESSADVGDESGTADVSDTGSTESQSVTTSAVNTTSQSATSGKGNVGMVSRPEVTGFQFPKFNFKNKTMKFLTNEAPSEEYVAKMKSQYGITVEQVNVAWADVPLKLAAMVLSGDSPDAVLYRADNPDLPSLIVKNLVQPIDSYVDLNNSIYSHLKEMYKATSWDNKHYLLINNFTRGSYVFYNTKLFKDYGAEDPWTLYKQGKWDWNKFAEVAAMCGYDDYNYFITVFSRTVGLSPGAWRNR